MIIATNSCKLTAERSRDVFVAGTRALLRTTISHERVHLVARTVAGNLAVSTVALNALSHLGIVPCTVSRLAVTSICTRGIEGKWRIDRSSAKARAVSTDVLHYERVYTRVECCSAHMRRTVAL